jgi:hypothetical protein
MTRFRAFLLMANVVSAAYNVAVWQIVPLPQGWVFVDGAICALNVGAVLLILGTWLGTTLDRWNAKDRARQDQYQAEAARVAAMRQQLGVRGYGWMLYER